MFQKATTKVLEEYIEEIYDNGIKLSNYFNVDLTDVEFYKTEFSIILKKSFVSFSRVYFLTCDLEDLKKVLMSINDAQVINFPTHGESAIFENVMISCGYDFYKVYEKYINKQIRGNDDFVRQFALELDFYRIKELLYSELNEYSDYLPNDDKLLMIIKNKQVLVNYEAGEICGIFIFSIQDSRCYFNFWVDKGKNGLFLIYNMYNYLKEMKISYSYLWADSKNEKVKKIHKLFGSIPSGGKNIIYTKNL